MITKKYKAKVEKGQLHLYNKEMFTSDIQKMKDGMYFLSIKKLEKARSGQQNRYYWGVVLKIISDETGDDIDSLHDNFKWMFLKEVGNKFHRIKSTTELSTADFTDYIEKICRFVANELSINVPSPEQVEF